MLVESRYITGKFGFETPSDLMKACSLLGEPGSAALAGGTDILNNLKTGKTKADRLIYIRELKELNSLVLNDSLSIGAGVSLYSIEKNPDITQKFPALNQAVNAIGSWQIRQTATLAGNLGNASPGADSPPTLAAYGARVKTAYTKGSDLLSREIPVAEFFKGPGQSVLENGELIRSIEVPIPAENSGCAFKRVARVSLDIAKINCSVYLEKDRDKCSELRIFFGSVGPTILQAKKAGQIILDQGVSKKSLDNAASCIFKDISPITDVRSTARYRLKVAQVLLKDVFTSAWRSAGGKEII